MSQGAIATTGTERDGESSEIAIIEARRECEQAICSFAFVDTPAFNRACTIVSDKDFIDKDLRAIFEVAVELLDAYGRIDKSSVVSELKKRGVFRELGGTRFIGTLLAAGYAPAMATYYASELKEFADLGNAVSAAQQLIKDAKARRESCKQLLADFESRTIATGIARGSSELVSLSEASREAIKRQRQAIASGVPQSLFTGFPSLDEATGGMHRGQLILLSGRTFTGKTTFALNIAQYFGQRERPSLFVCLEMKDYELAERVLCADADVMLNQWATGNFDNADFDRMERSAQEQDRWPVRLSKDISETTTSIRAKAKIAKAQLKSLDLVVVDHLQRITPRDHYEKRHRQLIEITTSLKNLARELDCVVLLLSQLKTDSESEPTDADYSEGKAILQEADQAWMLHRKKKEPGGKIIINKNRKNLATEVPIGFDGSHQRFYDSGTAPIESHPNYCSDFA